MNGGPGKREPTGKSHGWSVPIGRRCGTELKLTPFKPCVCAPCKILMYPGFSFPSMRTAWNYCG